MEKRQGKRLLITFTLALTLLLAACTTTSVADTPSAPPATAEPATTAAPILPSPTSTITSTPTVTSTPTPPPCTDTHGTLEEKTVSAPSLKGDLAYLVYLPPCYDPNREDGYLSVYLIHGQTYSPQQWVDLGLVEIADRLFSEKIADPYLIVMPHELNGFADPYHAGFGPAIIENLVPAVDRDYNTCTDRDCRAIGGISRGGGWAIYLGYTNLKLFSRIGGHSAVPYIGIDSFISRAKEANLEIPYPELKMDYGRGDNWLHFALAFEKYLIAKEIPYTMEMDSGYHDETYWKRHLENYLRWYGNAPLIPLSTATPWPTLSGPRATPTP